VFFRFSEKTKGATTFVSRMWIVNRAQKKPVRCSICGDELTVNGEMFFRAYPNKYCLGCVFFEEMTPDELKEWNRLTYGGPTK